MNNLIDSLNQDDFSKAKASLDKILQNGKLDKDTIRKILFCSNNLVIETFLVDYKYFDEHDIRFLNTYILENLTNTDRLLVSDLIEFATYWEIELPYKDIIAFLSVYNDDNYYVLLASIDYIFENLKLTYIGDIVNKLISIKENPEIGQSAQVKALFVLFRITQKRLFLQELIDLVIKGEHKDLLRNYLSLEYNKQEYFDYHDFLYYICVDNS